MHLKDIAAKKARARKTKTAKKQPKELDFIASDTHSEYTDNSDENEDTPKQIQKKRKNIRTSSTEDEITQPKPRKAQRLNLSTESE